MTTAITATQQPQALSAETLEAVVVGGDLSKLTAAQRLEWYRNRCDAAGLDPRTQPFQYITLQGKLTLYATKTATDQLIASRRLTVEIVDRGPVAGLDLYESRCRVTFPDGHTVEDLAALSIAGLKGEAMANAIMKCVTKAKRRTVLSACGLGMLDESEAETIPGAQVVRVDVTTGEVHNHPAANAPGNAMNYQADPNRKGITEAQRKRIFAIAKENDVSNSTIKMLMSSHFGIESTDDLTREQYDELTNVLIPGVNQPVEAEYTEAEVVA